MNRGYQNLKQLEDATVKAVHALEAAIITEGNTASHQLGAAVTELKGLINEERTHRLKLAEEQRSYVDQEDRAVRRRIDGFISRGFWSRLNWLLRGR